MTEGQAVKELVLYALEIGVPVGMLLAYFWRRFNSGRNADDALDDTKNHYKK